MSGLLEDLLGCDTKKTSEFFVHELQILGWHHVPNEAELCYVASILSHYASVSWTDGRPSTVPLHEGTVPFAFTRTELSPYLYENLLPRKEITDAGDCENKGSHIFLAVGFFRKQMSAENNVGLYEQIAQGYYHRASFYSRDKRRQLFLKRFAEALPTWSHTCSRLHTALREKRFLIQYEN